MVLPDRSRVTAVNVFEQRAKTVNRMPDIHFEVPSIFFHCFSLKSSHLKRTLPATVSRTKWKMDCEMKDARHLL